MRIGVFTVLFRDIPFDKMLERVAAAGISAVEIGAGGYPGKHHCPVDELLESEAKRKAWLSAVTSRGLIISALSCHYEPLSPDPALAMAADEIFRKAVRLAALLSVPVVNVMSGLPGGALATRARTGSPVLGRRITSQC